MLHFFPFSATPLEREDTIFLCFLISYFLPNLLSGDFLSLLFPPTSTESFCLVYWLSNWTLRVKTLGLSSICLIHIGFSGFPLLCDFPLIEYSTVYLCTLLSVYLWFTSFICLFLLLKCCRHEPLYIYSGVNMQVLLWGNVVCGTCCISG